MFVEICVLKLYLKYVSIETATEMCVSKLYLKYVSVKTVIKDMCVETVLEIICVETLFQTLKKIQKKKLIPIMHFCPLKKPTLWKHNDAHHQRHRRDINSTKSFVCMHVVHVRRLGWDDNN